ncbi:MAG: glutamine--fructose-6-phosphate transaminase (isomerizing) [archaeon]
MCGIFGCVLRTGDAAPILRGALERLEYRGYDSVGQATLHDGKLLIKKDVGKIADVHSRLNLDDMRGSIGIAHTRWATHGAPSQENAHPHNDCTNKIAIIHNGIIENFMDLRRKLEERGHHFKSRTDSEVVAHIVEDSLREGMSLEAAVLSLVKKIEGSYAIAVIAVDYPDRIVCLRKESPLVAGIGDEGAYCASDVPAFLPMTNRVVFLEEDEMAVIKLDGIHLFNSKTGEVITRSPVQVNWTAEAARKEGYSHFMLKEIHQQEETIRNALRTQRIYHELTASKILEADRVFLTACGTAFHSCLAASRAFTKLAGVYTQPIVASEFSDMYANLVTENSLVIAVSQSGETADTLGAVRDAAKHGASIVSVTNVMGSTLTRLSDVYIGQNSGPEIGVAATKTFTAQVATLTKLAVVLGEKKGALSDSESVLLMQKLEQAASIVERVVSNSSNAIESMARRYRDQPSFCFLGRGMSEVTALEARLKLLEIAYVPALAYPAGESKHGFIALVEPDYPVVVIAPNDNTHSKIIGNIMEMKARGARILAIMEEGDDQIRSLADDYVEIPVGTEDVMTPLTYVVPLQLFAYHMAVQRGHDPDQPRNLAKSVTVY